MSKRLVSLILIKEILSTGKSLSEAFILTSTNPQYDKILFIDLSVQYMKTTSSEHAVYMNCSECQNKNKERFLCKTCSPHVLLSYCGLVDVRINASDKDLPVQLYKACRIHVNQCSGVFFYEIIHKSYEK